MNWKKNYTAEFITKTIERVLTEAIPHYSKCDVSKSV